MKPTSLCIKPGNSSFRLFGISVDVPLGAHNYSYSSMASSEELTEKEQAFLDACTNHAGVKEVTVRKGEVSVEMTDIYAEDYEGVSEIIDHMIPLIKKEFFADTCENVEVKHLDNSAKYKDSRYDD